MDIAALRHLATATAAMVPQVRFIVIGSASILGTYPDLGFESRLIRVDPSLNAFALDAHDMAAAKVVAGRPKDVRFLAALIQMGKLDPLVVQDRLSTIAMTEKFIVRTQATLERVVEQSGQP